MLLYVGSYTPDAGGDGTGITVWDADLRPAAPPVPLAAPSFLVAHPTAPVVYAVNELADGAVTRLTADPAGALTPAGRAPTGGAEPCHLAVTPDARHLLCANYGSGQVAVFALGPDGALGARTDLVAHHGSGPDPDRQQGPHAHHVSYRDDEVTAVDLGTDTLYGYRLDGDGRLAPAWSAYTGARTGPRHLAVAPDGRRYVADELGSTVSTYVPGPTGLRLTHRCRSTLTEPAGVNYPAEIAVSPDGRYVWVANRGNDTIATFATGPDGLTGVDETSLGGRWPRHFRLADGRLYVANQYSNQVSVLRVDRETGIPQATGAQIAVPSPACVLVRR